MARDYDSAVGRYIEPDPMGQRFFFALSNLSSMTHHGYWNHLYNYVDANPASLEDPRGLENAIFDFFWDLFREKTREKVTVKSVAEALAAVCITQHCGQNRSDTALSGDCGSLLNEWIQKQGKEVIGAISAVVGDAGAAAIVVSECAEACAKGIKGGACCKGGGK